MSKYVPKGISSETRARWAELARQNKPRKGRGLVAPVFVRDGVPGKCCTKCLEWLPLERFARHPTCSGGRRNTCTTCEGRQAYSGARDRCISNVRAYQKRYPEAHNERKRAAERRRHGRIVAGKGVSVAEYRAIQEAYGGACAYCFGKAETMDHVVPLSRGGKHEASNLVPACKDCNFRKHNSMPTGWIDLTTRKGG